MTFDDTVIVKLEPLATFLGAKERTVMSPVQVTTVNQNTLKVVDLRLRGVCVRERGVKPRQKDDIKRNEMK